jgi:hypothetical protein
LKDKEKLARQKEIREQIANGDIKSSAKLDTDEKAAKSGPTNEDQPASNWSDDDEEGDEDYDPEEDGEGDDEDDSSSSESESENEEKPVAKKSKSN